MIIMANMMVGKRLFGRKSSVLGRFAFGSWILVFSF